MMSSDRLRHSPSFIPNNTEAQPYKNLSIFLRPMTKLLAWNIHRAYKQLAIFSPSSRQTLRIRSAVLVVSLSRPGSLMANCPSINLMNIIVIILYKGDTWQYQSRQNDLSANHGRCMLNAILCEFNRFQYFNACPHHELPTIVNIAKIRSNSIAFRIGILYSMLILFVINLFINWWINERMPVMIDSMKN
jgi:hypothetical protein